MSIDLSGKFYKFNVNVDLQQSKSSQVKNSEDVEPVVISTSKDVSSEQVLSFMAANATINRSIMSVEVNTLPSGTNSSNAQETTKEPTAEELLVQEAKELAENSDFKATATGSKTLVKEKRCTKGRNMGVDAMNLVTKYLETDIKNQLKTQFLDKYSSVLSQLGYSTSDISEKFETMYNSTKSEIATMAKNLDSKFVTYGNKGFLKNKGWVKVDTQKLVDAFMAKFNQKAGALANSVNEQAIAKLEATQVVDNEETEKSAIEEICLAYQNGEVKVEKLIEILTEMGAKNIKTSIGGNVIFEIEGKEYSITSQPKNIINIGGVSDLFGKSAVNSSQDSINQGLLKGPEELSDFLFLSMERFENYRDKVGFKPGDMITIKINDSYKTMIVATDGTLHEVVGGFKSEGNSELDAMIFDTIDEFAKAWKAGAIDSANTSSCAIKYNDSYLTVLFVKSGDAIVPMFINDKNQVVYIDF